MVSKPFSSHSGSGRSPHGPSSLYLASKIRHLVNDMDNSLLPSMTVIFFYKRHEDEGRGQKLIKVPAFGSITSDTVPISPLLWSGQPYGSCCPIFCSYLLYQPCFPGFLMILETTCHSSNMLLFCLGCL